LPGLDFDADQVARWNEALLLMLKNPAIAREWEKAFSTARMFKGQQILFEKLEHGWMNFGQNVQPVE